MPLTATARAYAFASLFGLPLLIRIVEPHGRDQQVFAVLGREAWQGLLPYRDLFEHKPPGVIFAAMAAHLLDEGAGWALGGFDVLAALLTAWLLGQAVAHGRPGPHWQGPLVAGLYLLAGRSEVFGGWWTRLQPEVLQDLAVAAALFAGVRHRWALAGVALMAAWTLKFTYIGLWPLWALWALRSAGPRALLRLHLGIAVPALALTLLAAATDVLLPMFDAVVRFNLLHAGVSRLSAADLLAQSVQALQHIGLALPLVAIGGAIGLAMELAALRRPLATETEAAPRWLFPGLLAAALLQTFIQGKLWKHHLIPVMLPLAAMAGIAISAGFVRAAQSPLRRTLLALALLVLSLPSLAMSAAAWWRQLAPGGSVGVLARYVDAPSRFSALHVAAIGLRLRQLAAPQARLLVFGFEPGLYLESGLQPGSRWLYDYPLLAALPEPARSAAIEELIGRLDAIDWVVVYRDDRNPLEALDSATQLAQASSLSAAIAARFEVAEQLFNATLWRRRPSPGPAAAPLPPADAAAPPPESAAPSPAPEDRS